MFSRLTSYILTIVLTLVFGYLLLKYWPTRIEPEEKIKLIPIEQAIKTPSSRTIRTDLAITVESCNEARKEFIDNKRSNRIQSKDNREIEKLLLEMLAQMQNKESTKTHLGCMLYQLPTRSS
ncbi:hypothetical protein [Aliikangiella coralliicola]|uniref:Uncharacterized protein n=1 Tax=Aliikangiella coralliicola TaxID=2592383 RepID=A0A545U7V4_9GAMM|nr:hypothetical protein [Aliikangiella coralliicola]TQV85538.1 hypothetical protein FLL46_20485 [Aliikangiella coralliicola]